MSQNRSSGVDRIGWILGLAGLVLIFVGFFIVDHGGWLGPDSPVSELAAEITDNRTRLVAGGTVGIVGALALVGFVASLRMRLARDGSKGERLALIVYAFGVVMVIGAFVHGSYRMAISAPIEPNLLADAVLPLSILKEHIIALFMLGALGVAATMSISSLVMRFLPKPFAWLGVVLVAAALALIPTGLGIGGLALFLWLIVACLVLIAQDGLVLANDVRRSADTTRLGG
ncbi:MAG TPA: hypothetical protein VJ948_04155 [Acidimicrobiia bacterium]|nr:hypothetical protein [Acidimicrobiia bacterium]